MVLVGHSGAITDGRSTGERRQISGVPPGRIDVDDRRLKGDEVLDPLELQRLRLEPAVGALRRAQDLSETLATRCVAETFTGGFLLTTARA